MGSAFTSLGVLFQKVVDRLRRYYYRFRYSRVRFGEKIKIGGSLRIRGPGKVHIGNWVYLATEGGRPNTITTGGPDVSVIIGNRCYLNGIVISARASIEIGNDCMIGEALVMDTDFHSVESNRHDGLAPVKTRPIRIGNNVWIGTGAMILKGVTIGDNSVVGAGAVVRRDIPENVVVIGNPAQVVKHLDPGKSVSNTTE